MMELEKLATEKRNADTAEIDSVSTLEMIRLIHTEDQKATAAITPLLPQIAAAVDVIAERLRRGGRLFYVGAGTSGRLGILDAAECPPTYGTTPELVQGLIAGGRAAVFCAQEGAEDDSDGGRQDLAACTLTAADAVVGLSASGRTPYVIGALTYAKNRGAAVISVDCSSDAPISRCSDIDICALVGAEVITGSTRMKAGTAQKLILNMLSTGVMVRLGKVYGNLMVDVKTSNKKLEERACRIVMEAASCSRAAATEALSAANGHAKTAIVMILLGLSATAAAAALERHGGYIRNVLEAGCGT